MERLHEKLESVLAVHGIYWDGGEHGYYKGRDDDWGVDRYEIAGVLAEWLVTEHGAQIGSDRNNTVSPEEIRIKCEGVKAVYHQDYTQAVIQAAKRVAEEGL